MTYNPNIELARNVVNALEEKKAEDIVLIDLSDIGIFTDYFVICSGSSNRMLSSLVKTAKEVVKLKHNKIGRVEGNSEDGWIALDYGAVVVHIMSSEIRDYYQLEELWSSGKIILKVK